MIRKVSNLSVLDVPTHFFAWMTLIITKWFWSSSKTFDLRWMKWTGFYKYNHNTATSDSSCDHHNHTEWRNYTMDKCMTRLDPPCRKFSEMYDLALRGEPLKLKRSRIFSHGLSNEHILLLYYKRLSAYWHVTPQKSSITSYRPWRPLPGYWQIRAVHVLGSTWLLLLVGPLENGKTKASGKQQGFLFKISSAIETSSWIQLRCVKRIREYSNKKCDVLPQPRVWLDDVSMVAQAFLSSKIKLKKFPYTFSQLTFLQILQSHTAEFTFFKRKFLCNFRKNQRYWKEYVQFKSPWRINSMKWG